MKFVFTKHAAVDKFVWLRKHKFKTRITKSTIKNIVRKPEHEDQESDFPKIIASKAIDERHVLRVIYRREDDIIVVITFYPAEREEGIMKRKKVIKNKSIHFPRFQYEKEDDVLMIELNNKQIDYAEQAGDLIAHFSPKREAVLLEILDASNFFAEESKVLPKEIPPYLTTRLFTTIRRRLRGAIRRRAGKQKFFASSI